jgi:hypothetical protein
MEPIASDRELLSILRPKKSKTAREIIAIIEQQAEIERLKKMEMQAEESHNRITNYLYYFLLHE